MGHERIAILTHIMPPLISIVSVTRNNAEGLRRTLTSIREQSLQSIEVIVIDGNSSDHTPNVLAEFFDVVTIAEQDTGDGIYAAMNQGIQRSSGDWLFFLNSGDVVFDDSLTKCHPHLDNSPPSVIYGSTICDGRIKLPKSLSEFWHGSRFSHQAVFIHQSLIAARGYDISYRICGDYHLFAELYSTGIPFRIVDIVVADIEKGGISSAPTTRKTKEYIRAGKLFFPDKAVTRHHVWAYFNHKLLIRRRVYKVGQFFWRIYHGLRQLAPASLRGVVKQGVKAIRTLLRLS